jgi:pimeloyl-ACP methyl ester carboxylesterase
MRESLAMMRQHTAAALLLLTSIGCATSKSAPAPRQSFREGSGRTVVMLGGGVSGAAMFAPHARELANEFDVIRVQTLNVQAAETGEVIPQNYSVDMEAAAVAATLKSLGVNGPVDVVGSSYGAVVALRFASMYPERVRAMVLNEPPAFWLLPEEEFARDSSLRGLRDLTRMLTPSVDPTDQQFVQFRCALGNCSEEIPAASDPSRAQWDIGRKSLRGLSAVPAHREDPDRLSRLQQPVLLTGGTTTVAFHKDMNARLARILPNVETAELEGGHGAARTNVAAFSKMVREFLKKH